MMIQERYFYGCFQTFLHDAFDLLADHLPDHRFAIIRSVDSTRSTSDLIELLSAYGVVAMATSVGACINAKDFRRLIYAEDPRMGRVFNGFDEVWLTQERPFVDGPQLKCSLTSDSFQLTTAVPLEVEVTKTMEQLQASLACGDGCGLNCVTTSEDF